MRVLRDFISGIICGVLVAGMICFYLSPQQSVFITSPKKPHNKGSVQGQAIIGPILSNNSRFNGSSDIIFYHHSRIDVNAKMTPIDVENNFYRFVTRKSLKCKHSVRLGRTGDGGWDMCISAPYAPGKQCKVYSFGINNDWSFDDAISRQFGCSVRAFDPSMEIGHHKRSDKIWFNRTGIAGTDRKNRKGWNLKTLKSLFNEFGDTENIIDYLKMDVEYSEWEAMESMLSTGVLKKVKQFGFEIHTSEVQQRQSTVEEFVRFHKILQDLEAQGFRRWYIHFNPYGKYLSIRTLKSRTCCYELVYVNINFMNIPTLLSSQSLRGSPIS